MDKTEHIIQILHASRVKKGLSQRALSQKVGLPQSHISKIENNNVDLKTSTLIELARVLDLELMLVPRTLVNTVNVIIARPTAATDDTEPPPAYRLDEDED